MSGPYGITPFGLGPFGGAGPGPHLVSALAEATNCVVVTLSSPPLLGGGTGAGDALNLSTWSIQRLDDASLFTIVAAESDPGSVVVRLTTLEAFGPSSVVHQVSTATLRGETGELVSSPRSASFPGLLAEAVTSTLNQGRRVTRDLANPSTSQTQVGGTLTVTAGGDYGTVEGSALLKKLVIRRLITKPGDFFHLPNYGCGLRVKEPIPAANLILLQKAIERQMVQEPDLESVSVSLLLDRTGYLTVQVRGKMRSGGLFDSGSVSLGEA